MFKKLTAISIGLLLLGTSMGVSAIYTEANTNVKINSEINDDIYIASEDLDIRSQVNGDAFIVSGNSRIDNSISEDLFLVGGDVRILGSIGGDAKIAAGEVVIEKDITGDLMIAAGDVYVRENVTIGGDVIVAAGKLTMDGTINGDFTAKVGALEFNGNVLGESDIRFKNFTNSSEEGKFQGNLFYKTQDKNQIIEKLAESEVEFKSVQSIQEIKEEAKGVIGMYTIFKIIAIFIFSSLIFFFMEKVFERTAEILKERTGKSFLYGLGTIILLPIVILILMISMIGLPIAIILIFGYIYTLLLLPIINTTVLTSLMGLHCKEKFNIWFKLLTLFILSILFAVINGLSLIVGLFTLGALILMDLEVIKIIRDTDFKKQK